MLQKLVADPWANTGLKNKSKKIGEGFASALGLPILKIFYLFCIYYLLLNRLAEW